MIELRGKIEITQLQGKIALIPADSQLALQEKTVNANGEVTADAGYDGLSKVTVAVPVWEGGSY